MHVVEIELGWVLLRRLNSAVVLELEIALNLGLEHCLPCLLVDYLFLSLFLCFFLLNLVINFCLCAETLENLRLLAVVVLGYLKINLPGLHRPLFRIGRRRWRRILLAFALEFADVSFLDDLVSDLHDHILAELALFGDKLRSEGAFLVDALRVDVLLAEVAMASVLVKGCEFAFGSVVQMNMLLVDLYLCCFVVGQVVSLNSVVFGAHFHIVVVADRHLRLI